MSKPHKEQKANLTKSFLPFRFFVAICFHRYILRLHKEQTSRRAKNKPHKEFFCLFVFLQEFFLQQSTLIDTSYDFTKSKPHKEFFCLFVFLQEAFLQPSTLIDTSYDFTKSKPHKEFFCLFVFLQEAFLQPSTLIDTSYDFTKKPFTVNRSLSTVNRKLLTVNLMLQHIHLLVLFFTGFTRVKNNSDFSI